MFLAVAFWILTMQVNYQSNNINDLKSDITELKFEEKPTFSTNPVVVSIPTYCAIQLNLVGEERCINRAKDLKDLPDDELDYLICSLSHSGWNSHECKLPKKKVHFQKRRCNEHF